MQTLMLALAAFLLLCDFQNLLSCWRGRTLTPAAKHTSKDFTIIVPLYGHPRYFAGRHELTHYRANVLVALEASTPLMRDFADQLETEGFRVSRIMLPNPNPAGLVAAALRDVTTTIALRLDADTSVADNVEQGVAALITSGADLCSVKCEVANPDRVVTKLQNLEYRMAMLSRHFRPWLTSGACFAGRTESLRQIYAKHSMWTPGEDIETGRVAHALKMKIRHCDIVVRTEAPDTWRGLFRQRKLWWAGNFRHWAINADKNLLHMPIMSCYSLLAVWISFYFKWWSMIDWHELPYTLPMLWVAYVAITFLANTQVRSRWMLLFPFYSLLQTTIMPPLGVITYLLLLRKQGYAGRYRFGYERRRPLPSLPPQAG